MAIKALIFDFWGTLVENGVSSPLFSTYKILRVPMPFSPFVIQFEETFFTRKFNDQTEGFVSVCDTFNVRPLPIVIDKLIGIWNKNKLLAKPYEDTIAGSKALREKGFKLALVSNAPMNSVEPVLEKFEMNDLFDVVHISSNTGILKQNPEIFDHLSKELGVTKDEMLMIGDSMETDIAGAEAAGVAAVLMDRRNTRKYERRADNLEGLAPYLQ